METGPLWAAFGVGHDFLDSDGKPKGFQMILGCRNEL